MLTKQLALGLALLAALSACTTTEDKAKTEGKEIVLANNQVVNPDEVTCRQIVKTGTRIGSRVCKMNKDWHRASMDAQEATEDIKRKHGQSTMSGNGN